MSLVLALQNFGIKITLFLGVFFFDRVERMLRLLYQKP